MLALACMVCKCEWLAGSPASALGAAGCAAAVDKGVCALPCCLREAANFVTGALSWLDQRRSLLPSFRLPEPSVSAGSGLPSSAAAAAAAAAVPPSTAAAADGSAVLRCMKAGRLTEGAKEASFSRACAAEGRLAVSPANDALGMDCRQLGFADWLPC